MSAQDGWKLHLDGHGRAFRSQIRLQVTTRPDPSGFRAFDDPFPPDAFATDPEPGVRRAPGCLPTRTADPRVDARKGVANDVFGLPGVADEERGQAQRRHVMVREERLEGAVEFGR